MTASAESSLQAIHGFREDERPRLVRTLSSGLDRRLERFRVDQVELTLSVKDRDTAQQQVTLEAHVAMPGPSRFVATSKLSIIDAAVAEARDDLRRQINRRVTRREDARHS